MNNHTYVHGYSQAEFQRLLDQSVTLNQLLHYDSVFTPAGLVLEAGCGLGAQTVILAPQNRDCRFVSVDISGDSVARARETIRKKGICNVSFQTADIFNLPFTDETFDHVFLCFVLEHLPFPLKALASLKRVLKRGGTITLIEGDHGSAYYYPRSASAQATIQCLIELQAQAGGNGLVGRELYPLLVSAGFEKPVVSPRTVYADASRPEWVEGFTRKTFIAMVEGVRDQAMRQGLISQEAWDRGIEDLEKTAGDEGTFSYSFFKATGAKPQQDS
jgi:ubiquinone/menaquinone biosynthesis C-methylase UbiE